MSDQLLIRLIWNFLDLSESLSVLQVCKSIKDFQLPLYLTKKEDGYPWWFLRKLTTFYSNLIPQVLHVIFEKSIDENLHLPTVKTLWCKMLHPQNIKEIFPNLVRLTLQFHIDKSTSAQFFPTQLKEITLRCKGGTSVDIQTLSQCIFLEKLELSRCTMFEKIKIIRVDQLCIFRFLHTIVISDSDFSEDQLLQLSHAKSLEKLVLQDLNGLTTIHELTKCKNLKELYLVGCHRIRTLPSFPIVTLLEVVHIEFCLNIEHVSHLTSLPSLKKLIIEYCGQLRELHIYAKNSALKKLQLVACI